MRLLDHKRMNVTRSDSTLWPQVSSADNTDPLFVVPVSSSNVAGAACNFHSAELWSAKVGYEWTGTHNPGCVTDPRANHRLFGGRHHYSSSLAHHRQRRHYDPATLVAAQISPFICGQRDTTILDERSANRNRSSRYLNRASDQLRDPQTGSGEVSASQRLSADFRELRLYKQANATAFRQWRSLVAGGGFVPQSLIDSSELIDSTMVRNA